MCKFLSVKSYCVPYKIIFLWKSQQGSFREQELIFGHKELFTSLFLGRSTFSGGKYLPNSLITMEEM